MASVTGARPVLRQRKALMTENSKFIRRRDDSKNGFRMETGELKRNIRWVEVGHDAISPTVFLAVKPKKNIMSNWDDTQWPAQNRYPFGKLIGKTKGKEKFMLTDADIVDLCYRERAYWIPGVRNGITKEYLCSQLERRAWEKFGGPGGLKKARELKDDKRARRAAATSPAVPIRAQKTPSSLLHQFDEIDADSDFESFQSSSPPRTSGSQLSPFPDMPDNFGEDLDVDWQENPLEYKSLGFLDLTLSDSDAEVGAQSVRPPRDIEEIEVIEFSD